MVTFASFMSNESGVTATHIRRGFHAFSDVGIGPVNTMFAQPGRYPGVALTPVVH